MFNKEQFIKKINEDPTALTLDEISVSRQHLGDEEWAGFSEYIIEELVRRLRMINRAWGTR